MKYNEKSDIIILSTSITPNYLNKAGDFIWSINKNSNCDKNIVILLHGVGSPIKEVIQILKAKLLISLLNKIYLKLLNNSKVLAKNEINCLQHGAFIQSIKTSDSSENHDPIIIFTDADIIMQRGLSKTESAFLKTLDTGDIYVGINVSKDETLEDESRKLGADESFIKELDEKTKKNRSLILVSWSPENLHSKNSIISI